MIASAVEAIVFPGQGSQRPGMAQDFHDSYDLARGIFEQASEALGEDIAAICFAEEDERLHLTEFTQPCILTAEIAMFRVLEKEYAYKPERFGGHSLGEYSALVAAGAMPFQDAVRIVRRRGALMQNAVPAGIGSMAAVLQNNLDRDRLQKIARASGAEVANWNSPHQAVLSGKKEAVEKAGAAIIEDMGVADTGGKKAPEDGGVDIRFLEVSAPFHSSMMQGIESEFRDYLAELSGNFHTEKARCVVSNFTGDYHDAASMTDNLVSQISGSVKWVANMKTLIADASRIVEVGPNRPLGRFFAALDFEIKSIINVRTMQRVFKTA